MAKYGKNNCFDGVVLPEPKEEALRRMAKGVNCSDGGFMSAAAELNVVPCSIQCVFKPMVLTDSPQTVFTMSNSASAPRIDLHNGYITAYLGYNSIRIYDIAVDTVYDFVFVCDSDKSILYVNGNLAASFADVSRCSGYKLGYLLVNSTKYHFQGDYLLHRHFNYAMSADEVKALYNNGDPMGYVVPKAKRDGLLAEYLPQNLMESRKGPEVEPMAETYEFNIGSPYSQTVVSGRQYPFDCIYRVDYVVEEWDFQPKVSRLIGFVGTSGASVIAGVNSWIRKSDAKIGEVQSCFIKMPNEGNPSILLYGDQDTEETTARHLKVTIKGITPVSVPSSWLDSAKQLPLSDEYMEPLFQSIGGYDMAAIGNPKIII